MTTIPKERIDLYRAETFRLLPGQRLASKEEAIEYANQLGFLFFWPITGITYPSLWTAVAGDRPVADEHDDPGHVTWGWKDDLLGQDRWYYAKVLRKKSTIISNEVVPYFYALSENYGAYEEDYLTLYEQGRMTQEARTIYEALLDGGVLDTPALRRATHLTSRESDYRFNRGLVELQSDFKVMPVGVTRSGGWNYAFAYDIPARHDPSLPEKARPIGARAARKRLAELYFRAVGAAQVGDVVKLFGWKAARARQAIEDLEEEGVLRREVIVVDEAGKWVVLEELVG